MKKLVIVILLSIATLGFSQENKKMHIAINEGDGGTITSMISDAASPNSSIMFAWTALTWAIEAEKTEIITLLLEQGAGADVSVRNKKGHTPITIAKEQEEEEIIGYLESKGAK